MRILYVVHQFFPNHFTGTERFVLNTAKQMQRMGHKVEVLTYCHEDDAMLLKNGIFYKNYEYQGISVISIRHKKIPPDVSFDIFDNELLNFLKNIITKEKYDIVHVAHPMRLGSAVKIAVNAGLPIVLTLTDFWLICPRGIAVTSKGELCHNSNRGSKCAIDCGFPKKKLMDRLASTDEILKSSDCIVTATRFLRRIFEINCQDFKAEFIPFGEDYSNVIPNSKKYSEKSEINFGFLSAVQPHKGAHILLDAFKRANMDNSRVSIYGHYFGESIYYTNLKEKYESNKVQFFGKYIYEDMAKIFNKIDLLVVPSIWWENSPLVLISALAHSVPAIVSNLGGLNDIVKEGTNGFVFEAGSAESLSNVIKNICSDPTILNDVKKSLRHPARIEEQAFEYEKIYIRLLDERKMPHTKR